jgi:hypothetical protein
MEYYECSYGNRRGFRRGFMFHYQRIRLLLVYIYTNIEHMLYQRTTAQVRGRKRVIYDTHTHTYTHTN